MKKRGQIRKKQSEREEIGDPNPFPEGRLRPVLTRIMDF
jgi:hypothetical protein